jgi:hypothetical protein
MPKMGQYEFPITPVGNEVFDLLLVRMIRSSIL